MSYQDRLAAMNDDYQKAPVAGSDALPPDGDYQAVIDRFDFVDAKTGRLYLKTEMRVVGGEYEGWPLVTLHDLEDREKLQYVKAHLRALQVDDSDFAGLEANLRDALDAIVEARVYTNAQGRSYAQVSRRHMDGIPRSDIDYRDDPTRQREVPVDGGGGGDVPF